MAPRQNISLEDIPSQIAAKFDEAQSSVANHRKNCVALYKLHVQASRIIQPAKKGKAVELIGENTFDDAFVDMVNRVLDVKKGAFADRIVKFVGAYVKFVNEKVAEEKAAQDAGPSDSASTQNRDDEETLASRFVALLLQHLFQGFQAKNKVVRQRAVHLVAEMMTNIGEIDEETYGLIRKNLIERIHDKEPIIRAHSVVALSKLVGTEDPDELEVGESTAEELILDALCFDTAAEVRRAALLNIPVSPETLPVILTRTRDLDTITRKLVFSTVLLSKLDHPKRLTIAQREQVIKAGLGDREAAVRVATGKLVTSWFDLAMSDSQDASEASFGGDDGGVMHAFAKFLGLFDVVGPGEEVAVDAMLAVFTTRPALPESFVFSDEYWNDLSPEKAILARAFVDHCTNAKKEALIEAASLPVLTAFAFSIQNAYNGLLSVLEELELLEAGEGEGDTDAKEEELANKEMILGELLKIVLRLDFADEIGRRKVFTVAKDMLAHPHLPPGLIERCLDVLHKIVPSDRELIRIVVEIIIELRDDDEAIEDDNDGARSDTTQSTGTLRRERSLKRIKELQKMSPEEKIQADLTDLRCLGLCIGMLERVDESFEDNSTLEGVLTDLIIPAVKRKESALREKGLISLGLCCLIAKKMAINSFQLFLSQVQSSHEELKLKVLKIIFDMLVLYDGEFLGRSEDIMLESEESGQVQTVLCVGICKLLLSGQVTDTRVLASLILTYVSPATSDNAELRQCLTYFFPLYCYSSSQNQSRMQSVFMSAFDLAARVRDELEEDQEMISLHQFGMLIIDWTNAANLLNAPAKETSDKKVHADLAISTLLALYDSERDDEMRKTLCQLLGQLDFIGSDLNPRTVWKLYILTDKLQDQCPLDNTSSDRIFDRFKNKFMKAHEKEIEEIDPRAYLDDDFREFYDSIGVKAPEPLPNEHEQAEPPSTPALQERVLNVPEDDVNESPQSEEALNEETKGEGHENSHRAALVSPMKKASKRISHPSPTRNAPASPLRKKRGPAPKRSKQPGATKAPQRRSTRTTRSRGKVRSPSESENERVERPPLVASEDSDDLGGYSD
ncbi:chromosome condensation complex Condensin, subunit G [Marasmius crinis-equi]|uniref:Chromosome condensation complex Condensin, subunit G n=1 Tax=Marasmius crinis-equi TaxID=585013 RepID=A0ABR3FSE4_9AGAR